MVHSPEVGGQPGFGSIIASNPANSPHHHKSPRSQAAAPYTVTAAANSTAPRGFLNSQQSVDSEGTIAAFFTKDRDGQLIKTQKMLERQQDRVEKVKRAREKAL